MSYAIYDPAGVSSARARKETIAEIRTFVVDSTKFLASLQIRARSEKATLKRTRTVESATVECLFCYPLVIPPSGRTQRKHWPPPARAKENKHVNSMDSGKS